MIGAVQVLYNRTKSVEDADKRRLTVVTINHGWQVKGVKTKGRVY